MFQKYISKAKNWFLKQRHPKSDHQQDSIELYLPGVKINMKRSLKGINTPHEVTVVLPRVEMRKKCLKPDCSEYEYEIIYNSITVVHAPRHPLAAPEDRESTENR